MNDWNQWEPHLNGWIPRRPSPKIKQRIFAVTSPLGKESVWPLAWNRMAAAASVGLAVMMVAIVASHEPGQASASRTSSLLATLSLSNQNLAAYYSPHRQSRQNAWSVLKPTGTFEWTNASRSLSTTGSFPIWKTNSLIH